MPSFEHEVIVKIAQERPETIRALLKPLLREGVWKQGAPVTSTTIDVSQLVPTQFLADAILVVGEPAEFALIIEVQRNVKRHAADILISYCRDSRQRFETCWRKR